MDNCIPRCDTSKKTRKRFKTHKPYRNDQLKDVWNAMYAKEKRFFYFNGRACFKTQLRMEFLTSQKASIKHCIGTNEHINDRFAITSKI